MLAFGASMTSPEIYERLAMPGIRRSVEDDSRVFAFQATGSIFRSYNLILDLAARCENLEALALVHQDAEILDPEFCAKVRRVLSDPAVGVAGCVGARGVGNIAWWEGAVTAASAVYRYGESGGGELPVSCVTAKEPEVPPGEVDTLNGFLLVLSPWAVRNVRFDESLGLLHGHDFDFCQQVRTAGRKVVTEDFEVVHHHSLDLVTDPEIWAAAHARIADKWERRRFAGGIEANGWERRARRAEAEAAAARLFLASKQLQRDALAKEDENRLRHVIHSRSWRITAPLRKLKAMRRAQWGRRFR